MAKELIKVYSKLYNAELKYSVHTEKFYVCANVEIKVGHFIHGICEHRNTPEEAVIAFHNKIVGFK